MIFNFENYVPDIDPSSFIAQSADIIGQVHLKKDTSVWYGSVLRGDVGRIDIGERTNIQDLTVIHVTDTLFDTHIGSDVTIGHRAIIHGCTIENHVLIGMGAIIMDGSKIGSYSLIGAGALVTPQTEIPSGVLALGTPAKPVRSLTEKEKKNIESSSLHYVMLSKRYVKQ